MSLLIVTNYHAWQLNIHGFIYHDRVYSHCHHHLARRLRQAFFMEDFL